MAMFNSYVTNYQPLVTLIVEIYIGSFQPSGWCQSLSMSKSWSKVAEHKRICLAGYQRNWLVVYLPL